MENIISVKNLSKSYGNHEVLKDISFDFAPGKIIGLLGPNGAGKDLIARLEYRIGKTNF